MTSECAWRVPFIHGALVFALGRVAFIPEFCLQSQKSKLRLSECPELWGLSWIRNWVSESLFDWYVYIMYIFD